MTQPLITMVVPYYRQPKMLRKQLETWASYAPEVRAVFDFNIVDDGSPEDAHTVYREWADSCDESDTVGVAIYRIDKDIPWNRGMARNLGTKFADTKWVLHVDTDHVLPSMMAWQLLQTVRSMVGKTPEWFRFSRRRIGAADETRKKDKVPPDATNVLIHPHIDSYLCTPAAYWRAGGYNEDFSGILGGGTPFLKEMEKANGEPPVLSTELHVYTRHAIPDSSEHTLPRDPEAFKRRKREIMAKRGTLRGDTNNILRLSWHKVL